MKPKKSILENRAALAGAAEDVTSCETCGETLVFAMRDRYHEFSIGLQTVIDCLRVAEQEGYVPPLPNEWWIALHKP